MKAWGAQEVTGHPHLSDQRQGCREDVYGPLGLVPRAQLWVYKAGFTSRACWVGV